MGIRERLSGNEATAYAMKQINPDVVAAYPITPSTEIPQYFAAYVDNGEVDTEYVPVESEHSAMSACIGAEAAGARAMTATSANGLEFMWEMIQIASSTRLPIVMALVNRAISGPLNIHSDHSDAMAVRDSGWIMMFSENNQEAYDNMLMAHRIAENEDVLLPIMICQDGFITSHSIENIELLETSVVREFVGKYKPHTNLLDSENPISVGPMDLQPFLMEHKKQQQVAMKNALNVIANVSKEFGDLTGRYYDFFEKYKVDDADYVVVCMNSTVGTTKDVVDKLRSEGVKAGLLKIRVFRPFPGDMIVDVLKNAKSVAVLDKVAFLSNTAGPLYEDIVSSMFTNGVNVNVINYSYGVGGRDVTEELITSVYKDLENLKDMREPYRYLGLKERK